MTIIGIQNLITDIRPIIEEDRNEIERDSKDGLFFNIFELLKVQWDEVRTHSAFLAELLNPKGTHGMGDTFLRLFIKSIPELQKLKFPTKDAIVEKEYYIGRISDDGKNGGRIDILIQSKSKDLSIVIENKIYARDENCQLIRYHNYVKKSSQDGVILYLTLDGYEADDTSAGTGRNSIQYTPISYREDILFWLNECKLASERKPMVSTLIMQYIILIKKLTNQMNNQENQDQFLKQLLSKDNIDTTAYLMDRCNEIKKELFEKCLESKLRRWAKDNDFAFESDDYTEKKKMTLSLQPNEWNNHKIEVEIIKDCGSNIGIHKKSGRLQKENPLRELGEKTNKEWPFGWIYCQEEIGSFETWSNGTAINYIKKKIKAIMKEIDDRSVEFEKIIW